MAQTLARLGIVLLMAGLAVFVYTRVTSKGSSKGGGVPVYLPFLVTLGGVMAGLPLAFNIENLTFGIVAGMASIVLSLIANGIIRLARNRAQHIHGQPAIRVREPGGVR